MTTLSIHADETFATALRVKAAKIGLSVNQTVQVLLAPLLGLAERGTSNPYADLCGVLSHRDAVAMRGKMEAQRVVDEDMWK